MEIKDYESNSNRSKIEKADGEIVEKRVEKVVNGKVRTRKRNRFIDSIISEEAGNAKNYILDDVIIPALKKTVEDVVSNGVSIILYGETGRTKSRGSKVSYSSYYDNDRRRDRRDDRYRNAGYDYDDAIFETRGEAERVLDQMFECLDRYKIITVADFYDLVGIPGRYTDNKYGWTDISSASVRRIRDGYVINLPRALAID